MSKWTFFLVNNMVVKLWKGRNNKFKSQGVVVLYINEHLISRHHEVLPDTECEAVWAKYPLVKISIYL